MKVNLPRYEKRERLCISLGTSDYLRTVGVTSVLAHCTVIHSDTDSLVKVIVYKAVCYYHMSRDSKKPVFGFPTRSDTNLSVQRRWLEA